jgi:hypothetical protein
VTPAGCGPRGVSGEDAALDTQSGSIAGGPAATAGSQWPKRV